MNDRRRRLLRLALAYPAVVATAVGTVALFAPRTFFDDFPFAGSWVASLPPYNEHLTTDVGGLQLAFAILFWWCAVTLRRELVVPVCVAWTASALPHLIFHLREFDALPSGEAIAQAAALGASVALPLLVLVTIGRPSRATA